jgi:DNA helicase-2/ATP-dependent DNA helicase PcrA
MDDGLNSAQQDAVCARQGPVLVLAGAGSGKTRVITYRIAHVIRHGTRPDRILAVTFTNKAAREMLDRALALLGKRQKHRPFIATFHSLCVNILRREIEVLGYPKSFAIYDRSDQESVARSALRDIKAPAAALRPGDLLQQISRWKTQGKRAAFVTEEIEDEKDQLAAAAYRRYEKSLRAAASLDFDDLLLCTEELFHQSPQALERQQSRFDHILVDEYQDTNVTQFRIISALARPHRNLCVVGDDDQSIYGWRGAEIENILGFDREFPDARVIRLEANYRSTPEVLALANTLIAHNSHRREKTLHATRPAGLPVRFLELDDEVEEAKRVVAEIKSVLERRLHEPRDIAILFRTNEQPRLFETELRAARVPYVLMGGMSFFDRREVRDLLAYLKVLANPADEVSLLRVINTPPRGIGDASVEKLLHRAVQAGVSLWQTLPSAESDGEIPFKAAEAIRDFRGFIDAWRQRLVAPPLAATFREMIQHMNYRAELERNYKEELERAARWNTVEELVNAMAQYEERSRGSQATLAGFLEDIALVGREEENDKEDKLNRNAVMLMTLHSAKGLEFPTVYLVGMEEGLLPHERSMADGRRGIAEERRLAYVGVTRARDRLTLTWTKTRTKWGKRRPTKPSRFLAEMRGEVEPPKPKKPRAVKRRAAGEKASRLAKRPKTEVANAAIAPDHASGV